MIPKEIINPEVTADLRSQAEVYRIFQEGHAPMIRGMGNFASEYFNAPPDDFVTRISPNAEAICRNGICEYQGVKSLSVMVKDADGAWRLETRVVLGQGFEPAFFEGTTVYNPADISERRRSVGWNEIDRALSDEEGRALSLDILSATKLAVRKRRLLHPLQALYRGVAKAKVLR